MNKRKLHIPNKINQHKKTDNSRYQLSFAEKEG
ncbi:Uncharacterised protein [Myroides odoratus]|uniref:Uncharacterized protein n=1 Tax=Myroides odoratus TaxID=256 RepID=A0A378RIA3_MYROD|nr:Uncharacterised protein [Myroides odoratus]